jgi:prefoldin subunit 5
MIPFILLAGSLLAGGVGVGNTLNAKNRIERAKKRYDKARSNYENKVRVYNNRIIEFNKYVNKFNVVRLNSLLLLGKAVKVIKKGKIKKRDLYVKFKISEKKLILWENVSVKANEVLAGLTKAGVIGLSTASSMYGLVSLLGTASTGTAIASLSGAAATNATLAWFGGGALAAGGGGVALGTIVTGGLFLGPAILGTGFFAQGKANEIENKVEKVINEMKLDEKKMEKELAVLNVKMKRVNELKSSIERVSYELKVLLDKANKIESGVFYRLRRILFKIFKGRDLYEEIVGSIIKTAKCLGELLDQPIVD